MQCFGPPSPDPPWHSLYCLYCTMPAADQLLVNKQYKELLQPYSVRDAAAKGFMHAVNPGLDVQSGALSDPRVSRGVTWALKSVMHGIAVPARLAEHSPCWALSGPSGRGLCVSPVTLATCPWALDLCGWSLVACAFPNHE